MKIANYKGVTVGKDEFVPVTVEELNAEIEKMLAQNVAFEAKTGKAEMGDVTNINYEGFLDGVPFEGGKADGYDLELGSHSFIPGFEEGLVGYEAGSDVDVNVTFPEQYHAENLAGKPVVFKCHVNEVKVKVNPELNDEFAQKYNILTAEELKAELERQMNAKKQNDLDNQYLGKLIAKLVSESELDPEENAVKARIDEMMEYYEQNIAQYGMDINQYLGMMGQTLESFRDQLAGEAVSSVKGEMLFAEIAKVENLVVAEEEIAKELEAYKNYYGMDENQFKVFKEEKSQDVASDLLKRMVAKLLLSENN